MPGASLSKIGAVLNQARDLDAAAKHDGGGGRSDDAIASVLGLPAPGQTAGAGSGRRTGRDDWGADAAGEGVASSADPITAARNALAGLAAVEPVLDALAEEMPDL